MNKNDKKILVDFGAELNKELVNALYKTVIDYNIKDFKVVMDYFGEINFKIKKDVLTEKINTEQTNSWNGADFEKITPQLFGLVAPF